ncbi:MAG: ABC transporter ATP-binding protein [Caulobacteraceae bacterium]|jgi:ABC-type polysaccharide/polyol phosphate transport system ATPase subunit
MAGDVVIRAEGLGKKYMIGHQAERERYVALRDVIARNARNLWRTAGDLARGRPNVVGDEVEEFWALRGLDFEVTRGEVVGVIGRNGAGKSTLLKVLSRITEPTEGRVEIHGRVASLLEVGTGFHPELTGRENIYLNGAVLGMTHAEIRRKFDEIVAFAEVERFLDTPVKRYSSGMYVRLAFAVAAHLEPEILIVDEVLAVGDAEFQKKCLGKMGEVAGHGRTVLFVSHNMASIAQLCGTGMLLAGGRLVMADKVGPVIDAYVAAPAAKPRARGPIVIQPGLILSSVTIEPGSVESGGPLRIDLDFEATERGVFFECVVLICTLRGERVAAIDVRDGVSLPYAFQPGPFRISAEIAALPLVEGVYSVHLALRADVAWVDLPELVDLTVTPRFPPSTIPPEARGVVTLQVACSVDAPQCVS